MYNAAFKLHARCFHISMEENHKILYLVPSGFE